ncbi:MULTISPECIES: replication initiation negative regulator SeqA [Alteromonadaceae]|uniref:replication initiation negative regulator SeqA n=1 Tax=Alteromonadaceae TaxID=72275 RepID=UPI001C097D87|nr:MULTISPECIES: replication initiation negative regulator SeqA [Aliiglaciecola]MBU2880049.1 replication initiation negative regulator SeqA [Aliiglaciecola lipolytica]MDO6710953.1 replication initiation negative regulator SeqA [Aliiglaciecola sp. 2_MG-2023]MDO6752434.1 replication initiation negative regulator SeqA [Aliiglaciecola sp. 1_MG-2023]
MKTITIDDELYGFIASQTKHIGESASDILRRILIDELGLKAGESPRVDVSKPAEVNKEVKDINKIKKVRDVQAKEQKNTDEVVDATSLFDLLNQETFDQPMSKVERFLKMLGALHQTHPDRFNAVLEIKGKGRLYFATDKNVLLKTGSSTNPKQIPGSEYWVVTNNNTEKKCTMLTNTAAILGYSKSNVERLGKIFKA